MKPSPTFRVCECGETFRYHRDLRTHRDDEKHYMPDESPIGRGPGKDDMIG